MHEAPLLSPRPDTSSQNVTIEGAAEIFNGAGVPRSYRTISRYCEQAILECVLMDTETGQKYLIKRESVEKRIREIKQFLETRRDSASPASSGRDQSRHDETSHGGTTDAAALAEVHGLKAQVKELSDQNFQLKIDKAAKEQVINMLRAEREKAVATAIGLSRRVGKLETQLLQLESGRSRDTSGHVQTQQEEPPSHLLDPDERLPDEPTEDEDAHFGNPKLSF